MHGSHVGGVELLIARVGVDGRIGVGGQIGRVDQIYSRDIKIGQLRRAMRQESGVVGLVAKVGDAERVVEVTKGLQVLLVCTVKV